MQVWFLDISVLLFALCRTKALVLELLAAVCLVRGGHEIILAAFDHFKEVREDIPFSVIFAFSLFHSDVGIHDIEKRYFILYYIL